MNSEQPDRETLDGLFSRVASGDATEAEWRFVVKHGSDRPDMWRDLAYALRDELDLGAMARAAEVTSAEVVLPSREPVLARIDAEAHDARHGGAEPIRVPVWLGWAAAALLFVALIVNSVRAPQPASPIGATEAVAGFRPLSTDEAFDAAYEMGREDGSVLSEEPRKVILQTREISSDAGFEIIFIEQVVRKATVPKLYQVEGLDERGHPSMIQVRPDRGGAL